MAAIGGTLSLLVGLAPATTAAEPTVDPGELAALRTILQTSDKAWAQHGGSAVSRCALGMSAPLAGGETTIRTRVRSAGAGGAAELRTSTKGGAARMKEHVFVQGRKVVRAVPKVEKRALRKHGMAAPPRWATVPRNAASSSGTAVGYTGELGLSAVLTGDVTELTVGSDGTYAGTVSDRGEESTFTIHTAAGRVSGMRVAADGTVAVSCRLTVSYQPQRVRMPKAETGLRARVAYAEGQVAGVAQGAPDGRTSVGGVRMMADMVTRGTKVRTSNVPRGVAMTMKVKGWAYPITWHVIVTQGRAKAAPVRTFPVAGAARS